MSKQTKINGLNYLLLRSIDYLSYHLKFKMIKHLFLSIVHQVLNKDFNVLVYRESFFFDTPMKKKKNHMKRLLKWEEIMIAKQIIYWIMNISEIISNQLQ